MDDENGENFVQHQLPRFSERGICFDFIKPFPISFPSTPNELRTVLGSTANVIVLYGDIPAVVILSARISFAKADGIESKTKVWVLTAQMDFATNPFEGTWDLSFIHGGLSLAVHSEEVPGFQTFLQAMNPNIEKEDCLESEYWGKALRCVFQGSRADTSQQQFCRGEEKLGSLPGSIFEKRMPWLSYSVYNAVYVVAHALHALYSFTFTPMSKAKPWKHLHEHPWQVMF